MGPLVVCGLAAAIAVEAADREPRLMVVVGGLDLAPPPVLDSAEVRRHLTTGLTTTLAWRATVEDRRLGKLRGGVRVEVRFEPWDEVFRVAALGVDGQVVRATLASFAELEHWWQALRPAIIRGDGFDATRLGPVRLELDIVPFSEAEERDTQRWFTDVLERADNGAAEAVEGAARPGGDALRQVLNLVLATSIQRRAVVSYRWTVAVEDGGA